jgi:hypothetical protein
MDYQISYLNSVKKEFVLTCVFGSFLLVLCGGDVSMASRTAAPRGEVQ